jgi:hypothetical protein
VTAVLLPLQGANIGRHVDLPQTRVNIARVRRGPQAEGHLPHTLHPGAAWQEVNDDNHPVDERDLIGEAFPRPDFTTWPRFDHHVGSLVPVTMPAPWACADPREDQWATKMSDGKAHVQPDRYITVRVMRHPLLDGPLGLVSWQNVQGAFTDPGQDHEGYRRDSWLGDQWPAIRTEVTGLVRDGITVGYAADTNRPHCPLLRWDDVRVVQQGLDALGYVEGRGRHALQVAVRRSWRVPLNIDGHDGTGALLALS